MHSNPTRHTMRSNSDWAKLTPNWSGTKMPKIRCENPFRYFRNVSSLTTGWGKFCCESEKPKKVVRSWHWSSSCNRLNESERGLFLLRGTRADRSLPTLRFLVDLVRFELTTFRCGRAPARFVGLDLVDLVRFELTTSSMPWKFISTHYRRAPLPRSA